MDSATSFGTNDAEVTISTFKNVTSRDQVTGDCADELPTSEELFGNLPVAGIVAVVILSLFVVVTIGIYVEEVIFILKKFKRGSRREKTIWILGFYPVFAACGLVGLVVPRSGTIVDMISNVYFSLCLYNFGHLMLNYMGGPDRMWQLIGNDRQLHLNTPPCCCCCVCLPAVHFGRNAYFVITMSILQVAIVRPLLMFLAAVLWTNNSYQPGNMSPFNGYIYITCVNVASTLIAYYGLTLLRAALRPELERQFSVTGKILSLQLTLLCSAIPNIIIGILVATNVITCNAMFPSKARGEAINCCFLVIIMLPFSVIGRHFYRRESDSFGCAGDTFHDPQNIEGGSNIKVTSPSKPEEMTELKQFPPPGDNDGNSATPAIANG